MIIAGIVLGFGGVALLVVPCRVGGEPVDPRSVMMLMGSTFAWALASVSSRHANLPSSTVMAAGAEMLAGGVLLTIVGIAMGEHGQFDTAQVTGRALLSSNHLTVFGQSWPSPRSRLLKVTSPARWRRRMRKAMVAVFWGGPGRRIALREDPVASLIIVSPSCSSS
jgi:hypothetical protein